MATRRVVITGLGILAPNGNGKDAYWDALLNGRSGIRRQKKCKDYPLWCCYS